MSDFPAIDVPLPDLQALVTSVMQLKEAVERVTGQRDERASLAFRLSEAEAALARMADQVAAVVPVAVEAESQTVSATVATRRGQRVLVAFSAQAFSVSSGAGSHTFSSVPAGYARTLSPAMNGLNVAPACFVDVVTAESALTFSMVVQTGGVGATASRKTLVLLPLPA